MFTALFLPATFPKRFGTDDKLQCFLGHIAKISVSSKRLVNDHNETCKLAFLVSRFNQHDLDFGQMALRKADIGEFFAEFIRFIIFTGFFWWLLSNGPNFANTIIQSLRQIASEATGLGQQVYPGHIAKIGFAIFFNAVKHMSAWSPLASAVGLVLSGLIMIVFALVGVNMLLLLCSAWLLAYAGVFFLGFGGSRWTSDIAINYYKKILEVGASLFAMILLLGVGQSFIDAYYAKMNQGQDMQFADMGVMLVVAIILLYLVEKVPPLVCGIVTGASIGHAGIGHLGAGAAIAGRDWP